MTSEILPPEIPKRRSRRAGRNLLTTLAALAVLATPARVAEGSPAERPRVALGAEVWRLRPATAGPAAAPPDPRGRPAVEIPAERRNVRMVYPALTEAR